MIVRALAALKGRKMEREVVLARVKIYCVRPNVAVVHVLNRAKIR